MQLNERLTEIENSNVIFEAQLQNKEFRAAVLNQLEEMSSKNSHEFKNIKSKQSFFKLIFKFNKGKYKILGILIQLISGNLISVEI
jgi:hypothetical protein